MSLIAVTYIVVLVLITWANRSPEQEHKMEPDFGLRMKKLYNLLFYLNKREPCPFCGGTEVDSVEQANILGLICEHTGAPCSHLVVNTAKLKKIYDDCFP